MIRRVVLTVKEGPAAPQEASYPAPCMVLIGRGGDAEFPMDIDGSVSRQHARLTVDNAGATLRDVGSKYGTRLNDAEITSKGACPVRDLYRIYVGKSVVLVRLLENEDRSPSEPRARGGKRKEEADTVTSDADEKPYNRARFETFGDPLGSGAWGKVHRARDRFSDRVVALKELTARGPDAERLLVRFLHERWIHQHLKHPHIVESIAGWEENSTGYHVMELVKGIHLTDYRMGYGERREGSRGPAMVLPTAFVLRLARQLLQALEYAHTFAHREGQGCLHRDIKPHNVMVSRWGERAVAKLTDFGLGRLEGTALEAFTQVGEAFGSYAYLPPEQLDGFRHLTDRRSDLFGLGATLYEALTGKFVYPLQRGRDPRAIVESGETVEAAYSAPWLSPEVCAFLDRAAHPVPASRYQNAKEMLAAVEALDPAH